MNHESKASDLQAFRVFQAVWWQPSQRLNFHKFLDSAPFNANIIDSLGTSDKAQCTRRLRTLYEFWDKLGDIEYISNSVLNIAIVKVRCNLSIVHFIK